MLCLVTRIELAEKEAAREKEREHTVKTRKVSASINSDDRDERLIDRSRCRSLDSRLVTSPVNDGMR